MSDIPGLPSTVNVKDLGELQRTLQAILQALNVILGRKGSPDEWMLDRKDLTDIQVIQQSGTAIYNPNLPVEAPLQTQPAVLTDVTVNGVLATVSAADVWIEF